MLHVLRLGHRIHRDERLTTHICLVARAFGADKAIITGNRSNSLIKSVDKIVDNWGGDFEIEYSDSWKKVISEHKDNGWIIVHLTMYGINIPDAINDLRKELSNGKNMLIVIGGAKVPSKMYDLANYNIAITNQPHSEVSSLAILLDRLLSGKELSKDFEKRFKNAKMKIIPSRKGKEVRKII